MLMNNWHLLIDWFRTIMCNQRSTRSVHWHMLGHTIS